MNLKYLKFLSVKKKSLDEILNVKENTSKQYSWNRNCLPTTKTSLSQRLLIVVPLYKFWYHSFCPDFDKLINLTNKYFSQASSNWFCNYSKTSQYWIFEIPDTSKWWKNQTTGIIYHEILMKKPSRSGQL